MKFRDIILYIRSHVPRPVRLPTRVGPKLVLRWVSCEHGLAEHGYCPLGLLPEAQCESPGSWEFFDPGSPLSKISARDAVRKFANWWDSQVDQKQAVDAVWGEESHGDLPAHDPVSGASRSRSGEDAGDLENDGLRP